MIKACLSHAMQVCQVSETGWRVTWMGLNPPWCVASRKKRKANGRLKSHHNKNKQEISHPSAARQETTRFTSGDTCFRGPEGHLYLPGKGSHHTTVSHPTGVVLTPVRKNYYFNLNLKLACKLTHPNCVKGKITVTFH